MQGHSGGPEVNPKIFTLLDSPKEWTTQICNTGSVNNHRSIVQGGLIEGGTQ